MADRREERERLRRERLAAERSAGMSERTRLIVGYGIAGLLTVAVVIGLIAVIAGGGGDENPDFCGEAHINPELSGGAFSGLEPDCRPGAELPEIQQGDLELAARAAGCRLEIELPEEGATHVPNSQDVEYRTNPPTSGNHNPQWVADGAYRTPLRPNTTATANQLNVRNFVHSMEHGRIEIQYSSKLPQEQQLVLKGIFDEKPGGVLLYPNDLMPDDVAVSAWTKSLTCPNYNDRVVDAIRVFRDVYLGQGPEPFPV